MECVICCAGLDNKAADRCVVPCGHMYHVECLVPWVLIHESCPLCRAKCSKNDIVLPDFEGKEVKAVIYLDDLVPPRPVQVERTQRSAIIRYGYDEPERKECAKTMAYMLIAILILMLFAKVLGVKIV